MSQEEYWNESCRSAQPRNGHGGRRVAPSHPEGECRSAPRRREKHLGGWGVLLYVILVFDTSALLTGMGWIWTDDVLALSKPALTAVVGIDEGDAAGQVIDKLKEQGPTEYKVVFKLLCSLTYTSSKAGKGEAKIVPGTCELNTDMGYQALIPNMGSSPVNRMATIVTVPEDMVEARIFTLLEERGVSTAEQLEEAAANYDFKFSFLKDVVPLDDPKRLEGYLLPDTYEFYTGEEPVGVLNKVIPRFNKILTDEMRQEVQSDGCTIQDVVTIVSMIEKEIDDSDQVKTTPVIYNHLDSPTSETAGYLSTDATILYAAGGTEVNLSAGTPYNTRTHKGLTPATIASPGVDVLEAAVHPDSTKYYFYALEDDGKYHFFATYREQ